MAGREQQLNRCNSKDYAFCRPRARDYCEGDESNSCLNRETKQCLRDEIGCSPQWVRRRKGALFVYLRITGVDNAQIG